MKTIEYTNYLNQTKVLQVVDNLLVLVGDNGAGKTTILDALEQGLKGKNGDLLVDQQPVSPGQFQVIYLTETLSLKEQLKFGKSSILRQHLFQAINETLTKNAAENQELTANLKLLETQILNIINHSYFDQFNEQQQNLKNPITLKPHFESFAITNLLDKLLKVHLYDETNNLIVDSEHYSNFLARTLLFYLLANTLQQNDHLRPMVILFDLPELYGAPKLLFEISNYLKKLLLKNTTIIIATNSPLFLQLLKPSLLAIHLLSKEFIYYLKNYHDIIRNAILTFSFCESNYHDLALYKQDLNILITNEDLEQEIEFVEQKLYSEIISCLFTNQIILVVDGAKVAKSETMSENSYQLFYHLPLKDSVFLYLICQSFAIKCRWINEQNSKIQKILPYFD